jgi:hypothetical protein
MEGALDVNLLAAGIVAVVVPIGEVANDALGEAKGVRSAIPPLLNRYTVTNAVVIGVLRFLNRYIVIAL